MNIETTASVIVDAALRVHRTVGPGMLESAYEAMLAYELMDRGVRVERQKYLTLVYRELTIERAYRIDMLVGDCVIVEVKSVECVAPVHLKQVLTYLKLTDHRLGIILNFGQVTLKAGGIRRIAHKYEAPG